VRDIVRGKRVVVMGRHVRTEPELPARLSLPVRVGVTAAACVVVLGAAALVAPAGALPRLPWSADRECPGERVSIVVEPELHDTVRSALRGLRDEELPTGGCAEAVVEAREAAQAVAASQLLPPDRAPQVWIPDSPDWVAGATRWRSQPSRRFAASPVVVTTSRRAAVALGWTQRRPTWDQVLRGERPMAVPDVEEHADSLSALLALWQTLGKGAAADAAIVNIVLAADRGQVPPAPEALAAARSGSVNAPVVPVTEQAVAAMNAASAAPALAAVYPREGSPLLTYPVMRVSAAPETPRRRAAVQAVLDRLGSARTVAVARANGFRGPGNEPATGLGIHDGPITALAPPGPQEVRAMTDRLQKLARPSRILTVLDVSTSMLAPLDDGLRRLDLASNAARVGMELLPDRAALGVWVFARHMTGDQDWRELAPIRALGAADPRGTSQRALLGRLNGDIGRYVKGGGTGLYDVTVAAFRAMHQTYDPRAQNAIILMTDGADEDPGGTTIDQVVAEIQRLNAGPRKVAIYLAGLGSQADYPAMRRIAAASGGWTYRIDNALQGQTALLDGLRRSRRLTAG
jgi:Ca-activated chloride channel family protein